MMPLNLRRPACQPQGMVVWRVHCPGTWNIHCPLQRPPWQIWKTPQTAAVPCWCLLTLPRMGIPQLQRHHQVEGATPAAPSVLWFRWLSSWPQWAGVSTSCSEDTYLSGRLEGSCHSLDLLHCHIPPAGGVYIETEARHPKRGTSACVIFI